MLPAHLGGLPLEETLVALVPLAAITLTWWLTTVAALATRARGRRQRHREEEKV